jgi:hypothetical protein
MRQQLMRMLETDDRDDATDAIVQTFWSRAKPVPASDPEATDAKVVDFARWVRSRGHIART